VYEDLRNELLEDLRRAHPVDVVLLFLHGAMVAQGCDDCEGEILANVRDIVGPDTTVGAELDLHSHLSSQMLESATLLVGYDEYPHTDIVARGEDLYRLCVAAARKEIRPIMRAFDCRMTGLFPTTSQPMRGFVDRLKAERRDGVLSTSLIHGFPWGDVRDCGVKCLAITDGDAQRAEELAARLGNALWSLRDQVQIRARAIDEAVDAALGCERTPVVLADVADNAGGGAPGDSTYILRRLLERKIGGVLSGVYYDPAAVQLCFEAGEDAVLNLRCGGKLGTASGAPLDLRVRVRKLREHHEQSSMDDSGPVALGRAAWVEAEGLHLVLASIRSQVFAPDAFTGLGIALDRFRVVVVKSSHHFWAKFAPIAGAVMHVDSPGALQLDFANINYTKRDPNYWPRVADPFAAT
jgi:microcystin degradation protein MlrC